MLPQIEVRETGYTIDWNGSRYASVSWTQIVMYLKQFARETSRYVSVYTQKTHWLNPNNKHFPILTPDGGVFMATSVSDSVRIADEFNLLLDAVNRSVRLPDEYDEFDPIGDGWVGKDGRP